MVLIVFGNLYISSVKTERGLVTDREEELDTLIFAKVSAIEAKNEKEITFASVAFGSRETDGRVYMGKQLLNGKNIPAVSVGDKVVLLSYGEEYLFQYFYRLDKVIILGVVIIVFILLLGGAKGIKTILSLALTCLSIFFVFIPSIKAGFNIYLLTVLVCVYIISMTLSLVYGLCKKSLIAALSCSAGVVFSGVLCALADKWMKLTGYINEDSYMLSTLLGIDVDVKALIFSMITIGALGAIMDISMSVTSPLCEMKAHNAALSKRALIRSGFNIGRDFMGTMSNTLILAYIGSSLIVVLVYSASNYPLLSILNKEEIIFEFLQSLIGCLGLLFTIPFTAVTASILLTKAMLKHSALPPALSLRRFAPPPSKREANGLPLRGSLSRRRLRERKFGLPL